MVSKGKGSTELCTRGSACSLVPDSISMLFSQWAAGLLACGESPKACLVGVLFHCEQSVSTDILQQSPCARDGSVPFCIVSY